MILRTSLLLTILAACGAPVAQRGDDSALMTKRFDIFPSYTAKNLNKESVTIPEDLPGERTLVVVAFQRGQQKLVDQWLKATASVRAADSTLDFMELPVIAKMNSFTRFWIDRGMRSGIPSSAKRARVVTLYLDKPRFRSELKIATEETVHAFLVTRSGKILWRHQGAVDSDAMKSLSDAIRASAN